MLITFPTCTLLGYALFVHHYAGFYSYVQKVRNPGVCGAGKASRNVPRWRRILPVPRSLVQIPGSMCLACGRGRQLDVGHANQNQPPSGGKHFPLGRARLAHRWPRAKHGVRPSGPEPEPEPEPEHQSGSNSKAATGLLCPVNTTESKHHRQRAYQICPATPSFLNPHGGEPCQLLIAQKRNGQKEQNPGPNRYPRATKTDLQATR